MLSSRCSIVFLINYARTIVIGWSVLFAFPIGAQEPEDLGRLLFDAFSSACQPGAFTQKALNETASLKRIIETLKNDEACRDLNSLYGELVSAERQLRFMLQGLNDEQEDELANYYDRLSLALGVSSNKIEKTQIALELADVRIQFLGLSFDEEEQRRANRYEATLQITQYAETLNAAYAQLGLCFERNKALPLQLASHLLAISGGFFDPTTNLVFTLVGRLVGSFFEFFNNLRFNKQLKDYRNSNLQAGLTCAMEALERSVCEIQDRRQLIESIQDYRRQEKIPSEWLGYELLTREFPTFRRFLRRVEAGSTAASEQQAAQRASFRIREGRFNAAIEQFSGEIGQARIEIAASGADEEAQRRILRNLIDSTLTNIIFSPDSILREVIPQNSTGRARLWLRIGDPLPADVDPEGNQRDSFDTLNELDAGTSKFNDIDALTNLDLDALEKNAQAILAAGLTQLSIERQVNIIADPQGALSFWFLRDNQGYTPEEVAKKLIEYFVGLEEWWVDASELFASRDSQVKAIQLVADTRYRFEQVVSIIRSEVPEEYENQPDAYRLDQIYMIMTLREIDQVIADRLNQIVQLDLERRMQLGLLKDQDNLDTIVRLGRESLIESLTPGTIRRLEPLRQDLDEAEPIARANLWHFFKHYREPLTVAVDFLLEQAIVFQEQVFGPATRKAAKFCALAVNDPLILQNQKLVQLCEGRTYGYNHQGEVTRDFFGKPLVLVFSEEDLKQKRPEERLCSYRRLRNSIELQEDVLRQRPGRFLTAPVDEGAEFDDLRSKLRAIGAELR